MLKYFGLSKVAVQYCEMEDCKSLIVSWSTWKISLKFKTKCKGLQNLAERTTSNKTYITVLVLVL